MEFVLAPFFAILTYIFVMLTVACKENDEIKLARWFVLVAIFCFCVFAASSIKVAAVLLEEDPIKLRVEKNIPE